MGCGWEARFQVQKGPSELEGRVAYPGNESGCFEKMCQTAGIQKLSWYRCARAIAITIRKQCANADVIESFH